jgi:hypothetical protein
MAHTYEDLHKMTAVQLRQIADGIEDEQLKGHSTMHKEQLLPLLCKALGSKSLTTIPLETTRRRSRRRSMLSKRKGQLRLRRKTTRSLSPYAVKYTS